MKKIQLRIKQTLFVFFLLTNCNIVFGQNLLTEDFTGGAVPATGWTIEGGGSSQWNIYQTNDASGQIPEMYFTGWNGFNGLTRMISPIINTSNYNGLIIEWKHKILKSSNTTSEIRLETTQDGINWNTVWSFAGTGFVGPETMVFPINNSDVGSSTFQFAFVVEGNTAPTGSFNSWRIDDIKLDAMILNDVSPLSIQIASVMPVQNSIFPRAIVKNWSSNPLSFDTKFEILDINNTVIYSSIKNVSSLASATEEYITFDAWTSVLGTYTAKVTTLLSNDATISNDEISSPFEVVDNVVWKKPLYEVFSSSHCGPCKAVNDHFNDLLGQPENIDNFSMVKYQQNFPGTGDPYYIPYAGDRRNYYGIEGIPAVVTNGELIGGALAFGQYDVNQLLIETSQIKLSASIATINNEGVLEVMGELEPIGNYPANLKLQIAIVEKVTTQNTGDNTETEFHNVMMTMLPNSQGELLGSLTTGIPIPFNYTFDMNTTFMEELNDLALVLFVQDDITKEVIQSMMMLITSTSSLNENDDANNNRLLAYPNPTNDHLTVLLENEKMIENSISIIDVTGAIVYEKNFNANSSSIDTTDLIPGIYTLRIATNSTLYTKKIVKQ